MIAATPQPTLPPVKPARLPRGRTLRKKNWESLGIVLTGVTLAIAALTLIVSVLALIVGARSESTSSDRYKRTIRPSPQVAPGPNAAPSGKLSVQIFNIGGASTRTVLLIQQGTSVFVFNNSMAAQVPQGGGAFLIDQAFEAPESRERPTLIVSAARDIDGDWWDTINLEPIVGDVNVWLGNQERALHLVPSSATPTPSTSA